MVVVDGFLSDFVTVKSGVPQGSVIGPIMFILFVNDILDKLPSSTVSCKLFADDVKLYSNVEISTVNSLHDALALVNAWSIEWQLPINACKCNVPHLKPDLSLPKAQYTINGLRVVPLSRVRDLGINIDDRLSFGSHIDDIITKAYQRIAVLFRGFCTKTRTFLMHAYKTYVRPVLEYCTQIWSPYLIKDINALEKVQKYFTKKSLV